VWVRTQDSVVAAVENMGMEPVAGGSAGIHRARALV
jgi:hypothetical protein